MSQNVLYSPMINNHIILWSSDPNNIEKLRYLHDTVQNNLAAVKTFRRRTWLTAHNNNEITLLSIKTLWQQALIFKEDVEYEKQKLGNIVIAAEADQEQLSEL